MEYGAQTSRMAVACQSGAKPTMSEAWPKHHTPRLPAVWIAAGLSVCWVMTSQPWSMRALVASASLPGSYQEFPHTHLIRSQERLDGKAGVRPGRYRWVPSH